MADPPHDCEKVRYRRRREAGQGRRLQRLAGVGMFVSVVQRTRRAVVGSRGRPSHDSSRRRSRTRHRQRRQLLTRPLAGQSSRPVARARLAADCNLLLVTLLLSAVLACTALGRHPSSGHRSHAVARADTSTPLAVLPWPDDEPAGPADPVSRERGALVEVPMVASGVGPGTDVTCPLLRA